MDEAMRYEQGLRIGRAWVNSARKTKAEDAAPLKEAASPVALATDSFDEVPEPFDTAAALQEDASPMTLNRVEPEDARGPGMRPDQPFGTPGPATVPGVEQAIGTPLLAPMRGITVGALNAPPAGPQVETMQRSAGGQAMAAAMVVLALAPPIVTALLLGLSHRVHAIADAPVWAWMAALLALGITVRASIAAASRAAAAWLAPVLLGVLLLVPAVIVLYLRFTLSPVPMRLAVAQVVLYCIVLVALLMSSLRQSAE